VQDVSIRRIELFLKMPAKKSPIEVIEQGGIEVRIYPVQQGYRVEISGTETEFYWHPGIFQSLQVLWDWLQPQLYALSDLGLVLSGEWMTLEGDFDGNEIYRDWFICQGQSWQGYDPLTNCCYTAPSLMVLKQKIDQTEIERSR
jgi:hypothetical protein